ncbi:MAG TPA: acyl-CoA dehydrogenase family protein [Terriglobales bacterium]|nr:acyl-CoA dehydrogenase family protein [Terriglobales bacterium]
MEFETLRSPSAFLKASDLPQPDWLRAYESWWEAEGKSISESVDRAGTPWLRMFDPDGTRVDQIVFSPDYWKMLNQGYKAGLIWRSFEENSLSAACLGIYVTSFYDPGLACPYTVSLGTAVPLWKYGTPELRDRLLPNLLAKDETVWQGATWMTEIKGGSDLGATVETVAQQKDSHWLLTGDKYFASNAGAELAVVAARPEGAPKNVRGLGLYLVPRYRRNGELNYLVRRMKDKIATRSVPTGEIELRGSEAWLLGEREQGIYLILEVLNISRVANSVGSVALAQRAMADALAFAEKRVVFGKPLIEQPLMRRQFQEKFEDLQAAFRLAWKAVGLLNEIWLEKPPYSDRYHLFRLLVHLAKYWTANIAVQTAKWAMEVHGGLGILQEYGIERWLREAMILAIWEGPSHRQILDGWEVIERKQAHRLLFQWLTASEDDPALRDLESRIGQQLALPQQEREASLKALFEDLAAFTACALHKAESGFSQGWAK